MREGRFFSDYYDSVQQRGYAKANQLNAEKIYIGRLRFDVLLSRSLVLTDAMLLDGSFFLDCGPAKISQLISRHETEGMPIKIRARAPKLEDALVAFVKSPKKDRLKGFVFSVIENPEQRAQAKRVLEDSPATEITSWRDIIPVLRRAGIDSGLAEKIEMAWSKWIKAQEQGLVIVEPWPGPFEFDKRLDECLGDPEKLYGDLVTDRGKECAKWVYSYRHDRGLIDVRIAVLRDKSNAEELADLLAIESWFHRGYNATLARQHECNCFESIWHSLWLALRSDKESAEAVPASTGLGLQPEFLVVLGQMESGTYRELFLKKHSDFESWWGKGEIDALRRGIDSFSEELLRRTDQLPATSRAEQEIITALFGAFANLVGGPLFGILGRLLGGRFVDYAFRAEERAPIEELTERIVTIGKKRSAGERQN